MRGKYIIVDIYTGDFMKDENGKLILYDTFESAYDSCFINEPPDVWICKLEFNYIEEL